MRPSYCFCISYLYSLVFCRDVDKVHDMMDDIAEQQEVAREISEAISNPVAFGQDIDEVTSLFVLRKPYINFLFCNRMNLKKSWKNSNKKSLTTNYLMFPLLSTCLVCLLESQLLQLKYQLVLLQPDPVSAL